MVKKCPTPQQPVVDIEFEVAKLQLIKKIMRFQNASGLKVYMCLHDDATNRVIEYTS